MPRAAAHTPEPTRCTPHIHKHSDITAAANTIRILIATDNHVGYAERDPIRGNDSIVTFNEIMELAKERDVSTPPFPYNFCLFLHGVRWTWYSWEEIYSMIINLRGRLCI